MRVYLVQHGDAVPKEVDPDRPLTDTGRPDVERLAKFLNAAKVRVSRIILSGKSRAQQPPRSSPSSGRNVSIDAMSGLNPDDPPMKFAKQIEEIGAGAVIISHLPFLSLLKPVSERHEPCLAFLDVIDARRPVLRLLEVLRDARGVARVLRQIGTDDGRADLVVVERKCGVDLLR